MALLSMTVVSMAQHIHPHQHATDRSAARTLRCPTLPPRLLHYAPAHAPLHSPREPKPKPNEPSPGDLVFPYTLYYTLPDLLLIRELLRGAGCRCHLVSLLRMPLLQQLSWHGHFVNAKARASCACAWRVHGVCMCVAYLA